jgi:hypothetical protein
MAATFKKLKEDNDRLKKMHSQNKQEAAIDDDLERRVK